MSQKSGVASPTPSNWWAIGAPMTRCNLCLCLFFPYQSSGVQISTDRRVFAISSPAFCALDVGVTSFHIGVSILLSTNLMMMNRRWNDAFEMRGMHGVSAPPHAGQRRTGSCFLLVCCVAGQRPLSEEMRERERDQEGRGLKEWESWLRCWGCWLCWLMSTVCCWY